LFDPLKFNHPFCPPFPTPLVYYARSFTVKTLSRFVFIGLLALTAVPQLGAAPQFGRERTQGRDRVCVYQDIQYQGWQQCYVPGDEVPNLGGQSNAISSIRVFGRARITAYENTNFRGRSADFTSDVYDLGQRNLSGSKSWSDHIESLRVTSDGNDQTYNNYPTVYGGNSSQYPAQQQISNGVCVYDRPNYRGRSQCWNAGEDLSNLAGWGDRISSIRVFGGATALVYRDSGFRGESIMLDRDIPDLSQIPGRAFRNWAGQISSLQIEDRSYGFPGRGRGRGRGRS
jgi:peptidase inhibitor family I36